MIDPKKILTDIDLSNNNIIQVSTIKGPDYESSVLPRELNIEAPSKAGQPSTLNIKAPTTTGGSSKINISTDTSNIITLDDNNKTIIQKSNNVNETVVNQLDLKVGNETFKVLSKTDGTTIDSTNNLTENSIIKNVKTTTENRTIDTAVENIKDLTLNAGYSGEEPSASKLKITATNGPEASSSITANKLNIDNIDISEKTRFDNSSNNIVEVDKKLSFYSPSLEIKAGASSLEASKTTSSLTITANNGSNNSEILVDNETVDKSFTSSEKSVLSGDTDITGTSLDVDTKVATRIGSSKISIGDKSDPASSLLDHTLQLKTDNIDINGSTKVDFTTPKLTANATTLTLKANKSKDVLTWTDDTNTKLNVKEVDVDAITNLTGSVDINLSSGKSFTVDSNNKGRNITVNDTTLSVASPRLVVSDKDDSNPSIKIKGTESEKKDHIIATVEGTVGTVTSDKFVATTDISSDKTLNVTGKATVGSEDIKGDLTFKNANSIIGENTLTVYGTTTTVKSTANTDSLEITAADSTLNVKNVTAQKKLTSNVDTLLEGNKAKINSTGLVINENISADSNSANIHTDFSTAQGNVSIQGTDLNINKNKAGNIGIGSDLIRGSIEEYSSTRTLNAKTSLNISSSSGTKELKIENTGSKSEIHSNYIESQDSKSTNSVTIGNSVFKWDNNTNSLVISIK